MNFLYEENIPGLFLCILKIGMAIPITKCYKISSIDSE